MKSYNDTEAAVTITKESKDHEVLKALSETGITAEKVLEATELLRAQLCNVLSCDIPANLVEELPEYSCPLARQIQDLQVRLFGALDVIDNVVRRLEV